MISKDRHDSMFISALGEPLHQWLLDKDIIEILLNPDGAVYLESLTQGKYPANLYLDVAQSLNIIQLIAAYRNQIIDEKHPGLAADLPAFQVRFQAWIPPVTTQPVFAIRKHTQQSLKLQDYVDQATLSLAHYKLLKKALFEKQNIIIAGGTSSGKTTFLNALLQEFENTKERLFILEDLPELQAYIPDLVTLRTTPNIDMRTLVKSTLRMRPDRIIIGEVRDGVALELLKAWNTGHPGGLCTIHANSAQDVPYRLADLLQEVIPTIPYHLITRTLDWIVYMEKAGEQRIVKEIARLVGYNQNKYELEYV